MAFPVGTPTVTLLGTLPSAVEGVPFAGRIVLTPSAELIDSTRHAVYPGGGPVAFDETGSFSVELIPNDAAGIEPVGWKWHVDVQPSQGVRTQFWADITGSGTVHLDSLVPVPAPGGGPSGGGGAVDSVNGATGMVVLDAADVGADPAGAADDALSAAAGALTAHTADTTAVHGIADTAALATAASVGTAVTTHTGAADPHGDRADAAARFLVKAANLADLASAATARTNLGLGDAATRNVGTIAGTVAAGDDPRFDGASTPAHAFDVTAYGAVGDGRVVTDGAMNATSTTLTSASGLFTLADEGKAVLVKGAASLAVTSLVTTISGYVSATEVTLAAPAVTTVSGATVMWATDDTAAIQSAINAAVTWAQANSGTATVLLPGGSGFYGVAGPLVTGGSTLGNAQLTLPVIATTGRKISVTLQGAGNGSGVRHWQQLVPQTSGAIVSFGVHASTGAQSTNITANGNSCVIGGPAQPGGYGVAPGVFSNMIVTLKDLAILTTHSAHGLTYSAFDFSGVANAHLENVAYGTAGSVAGGDYGNPNTFANGLVPGGLMPASGNNDNCVVTNVTCQGGYTYAFFATEHTVISAMRLLYCWSGLVVVGSYFGSVGSVHGVYAAQLSVEVCTNLIHIFGVGSAGIGPFLDVAQLDTEISNPTFRDQTSGTGLAAARGTIRLGGLYNPANITITGAAGTGLRIIDGQKSSPARAVSGSTTVRVTDEVLLVGATAGPVTITLITAANTPNSYTIKKTDGTANAVTLAAAGAETIDGAATVALPAQWDSVTVFPSGGHWYTR